LSRVGSGDLNNAEVIGCDFCEPMLKVAAEKAIRFSSSTLPTIKFEYADAMNLPYASGAFDVCSIAYGIRNVQDVARAISEIARVTRSGGHVMILETGVVQNP